MTPSIIKGTKKVIVRSNLEIDAECAIAEAEGMEATAYRVVAPFVMEILFERKGQFDANVPNHSQHMVGSRNGQTDSKKPLVFMPGDN